MLNTQSSELAESIQDLKNFQVFVRVRPLNKDDQQLSSRKQPERLYRASNLSIQHQQQLSSLCGSSSPHHSPFGSKQNGGNSANTTQQGSNFNNSQFYTQVFNSSVQNQTEIQNSSIIKVDEENNIIFLNDPDYRNIDKREKAYVFDGVLSENSTNYDTFEKAVLPSLNGILEGYNATFFAYGITGSGKTHTIFGRNGGLIKPFNSFTYSISSQQNNIYSNGSCNANLDIPSISSNLQDRNIADRGICYIAIEYLLQNLDLKNTTLKFSFLEIYNENVRDLLNGQNNAKGLTIIEDPITKNICVQDLKEFQITSIAQIDELIQEGNQRRALAPTQANSFSSRSHAILILTIYQRQQNALTQVDEIVTSKLTIIDLAGSEKGCDKPGKGSLEGSNINKSLLALGNCINILSEKRKVGHHVPYRDSKLTRILKDTLGGNTKTVMIACVSQNYQSLEETVNTLNYASRATHIKRKISKNITQELDYYQQKEIIRELQQELAFYKSKYGSSTSQSQQAAPIQGTNSLLVPSSSSMCENCSKNKKSILSYDCSNLESVYTKSTAYSSIETKIKQERQAIQGQIQELTEQIKQSLMLENSHGDAITQDLIEQHIRMRNEQNGNQEEFLNRICNDLFQNVVESHQLISSLQEIEELLVQDYQKLLFYQKNPLQTPQVQIIINQLQESIRENEEIKEKMKLVLETNQEQKQNLKYVLLRISNKKQIQMEYDLKLRKQQLELLDLLEAKSDIEKQLTVSNQIIVDKDKLISQITQENALLKQQKNALNLRQQEKQADLPLLFSNVRTQGDDQRQNSQDRQNSQLKGMINLINSSNQSSHNKPVNQNQTFSQQIYQQEQQKKNQSGFDQVKNVTISNLFTQQSQLSSSSASSSQNLIPQSQNQKQKIPSLTPLTKDLLNYDSANNVLAGQQLIQQEQQKKNYSGLESVKNYAIPNLFAQQTQQQQQQVSQNLLQPSQNQKQKMNSLTPLQKDLANYDSSSLNTLHNKGSVSQTSVQLVNSPQNQMNINTTITNLSLTPKNDSKSLIQQPLSNSSTILNGSKILAKSQNNNLNTSNQQNLIINANITNSRNYSSNQPSTNSIQEINLPLTFGSYTNSNNLSNPAGVTSSNIALNNSNLPGSLLKQSRSQSKSGRYDNNNSLLEKTKQLVSDRLLLDEKKTFLEEQYYMSNNNHQVDAQNNNTINNFQQNISLYDNSTSNNPLEKTYMISPMDSCKNPMESRDTGLNISTKKEDGTPQNLIKSNNAIKVTNVYNDFIYQPSSLHTPTNILSTQQDITYTSNNNTNNQKQARRIINYDMDDFDDDCEPKIMSRRSSDCNGQPSHISNLHINDSITLKNPLETESELDNEEINSSNKKQHNFQNSPQIHKTSRTICTTNVNLKKKNFDVFESEI
ncbi:kinesin motor catalytic domain protein (macronuclear) [Tetrahymena thermophila SB210]|uniref:Kinesin motor catalytic domain protein n=1 Tax=Tetrahymena thermophila (strain SB210) TaxID=312017 RepID=Q23FC3_TETTS|nr:kinesin motor catalytic domain protein [Tetrahymena thermophila SB210]EAR95230.2 kinesin motor catalytic domain protein [Tetrahymena thermophila SB210]|eukprot:XP_001015475.2 kinesin motor catalytic domain protein [Tetrahymena thermophila SB210]